MRAVRYRTYGGPEVLQIEEVPCPVPEAGQVLIAVEAVGLNVIDTVFRRGSGPWTRPLPGALTGDVVGRVAALGPGVESVALGDRVAASSEDAYAESVIADARWLAPVPDDADAGEATVLAMTGPLAWRLLRLARVEPSDTLLVQSAAGGVGHLVIQLAKILDVATVIGTASSPTKLEFVRTCGADIAIDFSDPSWADQVRAVTPHGVDVVLDAVGGQTFNQGVELLAPLGRMVTYGAIGGEPPMVSALALSAAKAVLGVSITAWRNVRPAEARSDIAEVAELFANRRLRPVVHAVVPFADVVSAHEILHQRANLGRVVLTV